MKKVFLIIPVFILASVVNAQPELLWSRAYGGGGTDQGLAIMQAEDGSILASGNETSFGDGGTDGWLIALDEDGEEIWSFMAGGRGYDRFYDVIEVDGELVIAGYEGSFGAGQFDFWLLKLNEDRDLAWERGYGGNNFERGNAVIRIAEGGFAISGQTLSFGAGQGDGWVVATDDDGDEIWNSAFGGNQDEALSVLINADGDNIAAAGKTNSFGEGGYDFWMVMMDDEGEEIWSETYGGDGDDLCNTMVRTVDDCYVLAGNSISFGENGADIWMVKVDEDGDQLWQQNFDSGGDEVCRGVVETFDGGFLLVGHTYAYDDVRSDLWLVRTDENGELLWEETYGGEQPDVGVDVVQTADGGYAVIGWTSSEGNGGMDVWVLRFGPEPAGIVQGSVFDAEEGDPLMGVSISTTNGLFSETDEEGFFIIDPAWAGEFDITATLQGYNDATIEGLNLEVGDTIEVEFELTHPVFVTTVDRIITQLGFEESSDFEIGVGNEGNGPLEWSVETELRGDANVEPWQLRNSFFVGEAVEDTRVNGVVFVDGVYYVSAANNGSPLIHKFDVDGEFIESFAQPREDNYGFRDMAFDGSLLWGTVRDMVYAIALDGELMTSFESPVNPTTLLAYDSIRECLWLGSTTTNPLAYTVEGEPFENLVIDRNDLRIYGLAFYADDPDNSPLYILHKERDTDNQTVHKANIEADEMSFVAYINPELGSSPAGAYITNQIDYLSWVLISIANNTTDNGGDRIDLWQIEGNTSWMQVEPAAGTVDPDSQQDIVLSLNSTDLNPIEYPGDLHFTHNAAGGEFHLPVTLRVEVGPHQAVQVLQLDLGWNLVSAYLQPDEEDVVELTRDLVDAGLLLMMKDQWGNFYFPEAEFSNIPGWSVEQGYWIKVSDECELTLEGITVAADEPIVLEQGWQIVSYYPRVAVDAIIALSGIRDELLIAKDGLGNFYIPEWDFSNMGNMEAGKGYQVKLSEAVNLIYRLEEEELAGYRDRYPAKPQVLPAVTPTGRNMSVLITNIQHSTFNIQNSQIAAFNSDGLFVGVGWAGGVARKVAGGDAYATGLAVWGDDPSTEEVDGLQEGEAFELRLGNDPLQVTRIHAGPGMVYATDEFTVVNVTVQTAIPEHYYLSQNYPNPFNAATRIQFGLPEAAYITVNVYDVSGRLVATLVEGEIQAGNHAVTWEAASVATGVYLVHMETSGFSAVRKVMLVR